MTPAGGCFAIIDTSRLAPLLVCQAEPVTAIGTRNANRFIDVLSLGLAWHTERSIVTT